MYINIFFEFYLKLSMRINNLYYITRGVEKETIEKESNLILDFLKQFDFTKSDQSMADALILEEEGKPKLVCDKTFNNFEYLIQGHTENVFISVSVKSKGFPFYGFLEILLRHTPLYYMLFDINFSLFEHKKENSLIIFGLKVGSFVDYAKIECNKKLDKEQKIKEVRSLSLNNLDKVKNILHIFYKELEVSN